METSSSHTDWRRQGARKLEQPMASKVTVAQSQILAKPTGSQNLGAQFLQPIIRVNTQGDYKLGIPV